MNAPDRYLIIDDDSGNNLLCQLVINRTVKDPEIISFTSALKAIDYITTEYTAKPIPTMLFLDINMPTLSGWDVLAKFESIEKIIQSNFKIYMISSSLNPVDRARAMSNKFVSGYLEKPLNKLAFANILAAKN